MVFCVVCGIENEIDAKFCVNCGAELVIPDQDNIEEKKEDTVLDDSHLEEIPLQKETPKKRGKKAKDVEVKVAAETVEIPEEILEAEAEKAEPEALEWSPNQVKESSPYVSPALPKENYTSSEQNRPSYEQFPAYTPAPYVRPENIPERNSNGRGYSLEKAKPLSTAAYFWLEVLFCIPGLGFIMTIILSLAPSNINLKRFSRASLIFQIVMFSLLIISVLAIIIVLQQIFPFWWRDDVPWYRYNTYPHLSVIIG